MLAELRCHVERRTGVPIQRFARWGGAKNPRISFLSLPVLLVLSFRRRSGGIPLFSQRALPPAASESAAARSPTPLAHPLPAPASHPPASETRRRRASFVASSIHHHRVRPALLRVVQRAIGSIPSSLPAMAGRNPLRHPALHRRRSHAAFELPPASPRPPAAALPHLRAVIASVSGSSEQELLAPDPRHPTSTPTATCSAERHHRAQRRIFPPHGRSYRSPP